ncbi:ATP-binding protein [Streptomyces sp. NPDC127079]|uniref:ATP-binding protein n=1 Tax=Streptomyces sp. NPDC127079 TaxID=3347132 RepID=UPI003651C96D
MNNPPLPWFSRLELACEPTAVGWARLHAKNILKQWDVPKSVVDDALLVVSELATNAVRHSRKPEEPPPWAGQSTIRRFVLALWRYPDHVQIYVQDEDRTPPIMRDSTALDSNGRGLHLVDNLSSKWGYTFPTPDPSSGKVVWAQIEFPGKPAPTDVPEHERLHLPSPSLPVEPQTRDDQAARMRSITAFRDGVMRYGHAAAY